MEDEPVKVDLSFTCEHETSDIKANSLCLLEGSTDRTYEGKIAGDATETQCSVGAAEMCSKKRSSDSAFLKDKPESRNKVAFVSVKMPIPLARGAVVPVEDVERCRGSRENSTFCLIADRNLKGSLL